MMTKPSQAFAAALVTLLSVGITITAAARTGPGEYWVTVMKEEPIPEVLRGLIHLNPKTEQLVLPSHYHNHPDHDFDTKTSISDQPTKKKVLSDDFEPRPSASSYGADSMLGNTRKYSDDFEDRPSATSYGANTFKLGSRRKYTTDDFEPRPSATSYGGDTKLESTRKYTTDDFEPRPSASSYGEDTKLESTRKYTTDDFEPRPSASSYGEDTKLENTKGYTTDDFEPRPSASSYGE